MKREAYRTVDVKQVSIGSLVADKQAPPAVVGIDIAKQESLSVVRWQSGEFERPWRTKTPEEVPILVDRLREMKAPIRFSGRGSGTPGFRWCALFLLTIPARK
jgi:hypothetical protein